MRRHQLNIFFKWIVKRESKKPFFILCEARTGSGLLVDYLSSSERTSIGGEVLNPLTTPGIHKQASKRRALCHVQYSLNALPTDICGVKLHLKHCQWHNVDITDLVDHFPNARFIILYRKNISRQYISEQIASRTLQYEDRSNKRKKDEVQIDVDRTEFSEYAMWVMASYRKIIENDQIADRSIILSYEELISDPNKKVTEDIFPFLGIETTQIRSSLKKQNDRRLSAMISNYGEVEDLIDRYANFQLERE